MAIAESPSDALALPSGGAIAHRPMGIFGRPRAKTGWTSWITTVDHKRIGIMYGAAALFFFCIGGLQALLIRAQLAAPGQKLFSARSEKHTSELQSLMRISYAVFCLKKKICKIHTCTKLKSTSPYQ